MYTGVHGESGIPEQEPNDAWNDAQWTTESLVSGALTEGDVDCFSFDVLCHTVAVEVLGPCDVPMSLALHDPGGTLWHRADSIRLDVPSLIR